MLKVQKYIFERHLSFNLKNITYFIYSIHHYVHEDSGTDDLINYESMPDYIDVFYIMEWFVLVKAWWIRYVRDLVALDDLPPRDDLVSLDGHYALDEFQYWANNDLMHIVFLVVYFVSFL